MLGSNIGVWQILVFHGCRQSSKPRGTRPGLGLCSCAGPPRQASISGPWRTNYLSQMLEMRLWPTGYGGLLADLSEEMRGPGTLRHTRLPPQPLWISYGNKSQPNLHTNFLWLSCDRSLIWPCRYRLWWRCSLISVSPWEVVDFQPWLRTCRVLLKQSSIWALGTCVSQWTSNIAHCSIRTTNYQALFPSEPQIWTQNRLAHLLINPKPVHIKFSMWHANKDNMAISDQNNRTTRTVPPYWI